jgi:hypothetical protein
MSAKVIELIQPAHHQMKASDAIKRLQKLIDLHGDLKIDGLPGLEHWAADSEGPAFFYVTD